MAQAIDAAHWQERLDLLARQAGVVGAVLGILRLRDGEPDELVRVATGVLNASTGRPTSVDSLFQIGSITKPCTATVVMQLVEEGKIGLDIPVKDILPGFRLSTAELTNGVTVRHLLNHTSGIDGDVFVDTGPADDCVAKYMTVLESARQISAPGEFWSYCNPGFSILGRIIEVLTGQVWDDAMRERLFEPLGLQHTVTLPEQALLFDTAVGHLKGLPEPVVTPRWTLERCNGPAGAITMSVADLLAFARLHLGYGMTPGGTRVLRAGFAAAMRTFSVDVPWESASDSWGLGWARYSWGGRRLFGHDGNTIGQSAFLRFSTDHGLAVALMANITPARHLYQPLFGEIFDELCGITIQPPLALPAVPPSLDISPWLGTYERASVRLEIFENDGPWLRVTELDELAGLDGDPVVEYPMVPIREGLYGVVTKDGMVSAVQLFQTEAGRRYVHFSSRATPKIG